MTALSAAAVKIECNPNCKATYADQKGDGYSFTFVIGKFFEDPIESITLIIAAANIGLVIAIICQIRDSRQSSERQLRAYVMVEAAECVFVNETAFGTIQFNNTGQTPAYRMRVFGHADIFDWPLDENQLREPEVRREVSTEPLGPLMVRRHHSEAAGANVSILAGRTRAAVFWGYAIYDDTFGTERHTYFRFFAGGGTGLRSTNTFRSGLLVYEMSAHENGNDAT